MVQPCLLNYAGGKQFSWNLDGKVGLSSPNKPDDVLLVQFCMTELVKGGFGNNDLKSAVAAVRMGAPCSGRADDPLVKAIKALQAMAGGTQDCCISPLNPNSPAYGRGAGSHIYMLNVLLDALWKRIPRDWPGIDKIPGCPPGLLAVVKPALNRVGG